MKVLILDNYDSFTYNLLQILEQISDVEVDVVRNDKINLDDVAYYDRIMLSPGPGIPKEAGLMLSLIERYKETKNILGVCLGHQAIAEVFGGQLENLEKVMHGKTTPINKTSVEDTLFKGLPSSFPVGRYHSWVVSSEEIPKSLLVTARDEFNQIMAFKHRELPIRGVQFHPESVMTPLGANMIENWIGEER